MSRQAARRFRQLELFEAGPTLCEWCGASTAEGRAFCKGGVCRRRYERQHGKLGARVIASSGVPWAAEPVSVASVAAEPARRARR